MIRAQGAGGQNGNKVSAAAHLRFDVPASSLPPECKAAVCALSDRRLSKAGVIVIKAQSFRSQDKNRADAIERLLALIRSAIQRPAPSKPTRPPRSDRQNVVSGKRVSVRVDLGGRRLLKKQNY